MCHSYGLTETTFTVLAGESRADKPGSPGKVCRGFSCKVVDPSSGERLSANQTGELLVKSDSVMLGYVNNPAASAEAFRDGWLRTGDLCFFDPEGYFFVVDRIKDVIKFNSHQISPAELEGVVARVAGVLDVAVVGVPHPSHGETPHALVVRQDHSDLTEAKVMQAVSESVSAYKQLHCVTFVNQLPKTLSGKIQRKKALALIYPARDRIPSALDTPQKSAQHPSEDNS
ncbi:luciferin 4-monooxygenase-like [Neocloeon triangulifer]|nr:luciferin 4-monooxygenase-like [Neocloeon triangulifer]